MLIKLLWISALWLGIGLTAALFLWVFIAVGKRMQIRVVSPVRQVPEPIPEQARAPFEVLVGGGGAKPMRIATTSVDRHRVESVLISVPGSRR
ncbi:MAG: hypothetical protein ACJAZ8_000696 [Planctomycetota bacterium]|jgi:hypothetical protein